MGEKDLLLWDEENVIQMSSCVLMSSDENSSIFMSRGYCRLYKFIGFLTVVYLRNYISRTLKSFRIFLQRKCVL